MVIKIFVGLALLSTILLIVACAGGETVLPTQPPEEPTRVPATSVTEPTATVGVPTATSTPKPESSPTTAAIPPTPTPIATPMLVINTPPIGFPTPQIIMATPSFVPLPNPGPGFFQPPPPPGQMPLFQASNPNGVQVADASESWESVQVNGEYLSAVTGDGGYADADVIALSGGGYRMYVGAMVPHSIVSLSSDDGLNWEFDGVTSVANGAFPDAIQLPGGGIRLYYQGAGVIESALSDDGGLTFVKEPGVRINRGWHGDIDPDNVGAPTTVLLPDGRFRMYYRAGDEDDRWMNGLKSVILSAISDDGLLFTPEEGVRVSPEDWIDPTAPEDISYLDGPDAIMTGEGGVKLYFWGVQVCTGVCLAESKDGLTFDSVEQVFPNDSTPFKINAGDPTVLPMDEGPWLMYFGHGQDHNEQGIWVAQRSD